MSVPGSARRRLVTEAERFTIVGLFGTALKTVVLAQQEPQVRETKWHLGQCSDRVLSFPRMLFAILLERGVFENLYAYFLCEPYSGLATRLHHSILPNSNDSGWVCVGTKSDRDALMRLTAGLPGVEEKTEAVLANFWDTQFNDHVIQRLTERGPRLDPNLASLASWESASRRDPGFVNRVPWEFAAMAGAFLQAKGVGR
jgi:hypothetical protein